MDLRLYELDKMEARIIVRPFSNLYDVKTYLASKNARIELCADIATAPLDPLLVVLGTVLYPRMEDYQERLCLRSAYADQLLGDLHKTLAQYAQDLSTNCEKAAITRKIEGFF